MSRYTPRVVSHDQKYRIYAIQDKAEELARMIELRSRASRHQSLALTALEKAVMWATKAISHEEE